MVVKRELDYVHWFCMQFISLAKGVKTLKEWSPVMVAIRFLQPWPQTLVSTKNLGFYTPRCMASFYCPRHTADYVFISSQPVKTFNAIPQAMEKIQRAAPEGRPIRETQARTKSQASNLIPRSLPTEVGDPISKVEISAATLTALRMVMRDEITNGACAMESRLVNRMDKHIQDMKDDIEKERAARGLLETRLHHLEVKQNMNGVALQTLLNRQNVTFTMSKFNAKVLKSRFRADGQVRSSLYAKGGPVLGRRRKK